MEAATLRIRLLGGFSVEVDGALVDERAWRLRKARALVKLAALAPARRIHRDVVSELLWGDRDAQAAANNLHQALHAARRALGFAAAIVLVGDVLALDPTAWIDVEAFEAAAAAARDGADPALALALYPGELLPEDRFEPWTEPRRSALSELHVDLRLRTAQRHVETGDPAAAIAVLTRAVADAPRHEPARRALMLQLAGAGRTQDALAQFEDLRTTLRADAEAEPDAETRALYRELLTAAAPAPAAVASTVPVPLTSFVGRRRELAELGRLLDRTRLVTLTGPGGAGKTRLAIELAKEREDGLAGGAHVVDLAGLRDGALVAQAVATALQVPIPANRPALDALTAHLGPRQVLIVLDTCEHLVDACAHLAEALLSAGPGVRLLATSREPLRCAAEVAWRVPSLAEAPVLFRERAGAVRPGAWTPAEERLIQDICWRLDRMPLAVELAAARTGALTVQQIADRLGDALDVLSAGSRTALTRQQTLRAAIGWSHDLLTDDERVVLRRLSLFAGGFALEDAEAVVTGDPIAQRRVADLVGRLVDKSLVVGERGRFRLMDTIRQFGDERLDAAGECPAGSRRHLDWCLGLPEADDADLEAHEDDLRAALAFALRDDPEAALLLATRLWPFWLARSRFVEGTRWIAAALAAAPARTPLRVEGLLAEAGLALRRGDVETYLSSVDQALGICRELGDPAAVAEALQQLAMFEEYHRSSERSVRLFAEAQAAAQRLGDPASVASIHHASAMTPWSRSDLAGARARLEEALALMRALPDGPGARLQPITFGMPVLPAGAGGRPRLVWEATIFPFRPVDRDGAIVLALGNLAWVARAAGDLADADAVLEEALARAERAGDDRGEARTLAQLGHLARTRGDVELAGERLTAAAARFVAVREQRDAEVVTVGLALVRAQAGDLDGARTTLGGALERFTAADDLPGIACTRANWAIVEERAGDPERACTLWEQGAATWRAQGLLRIEGWTRLGWAAALQAIGDPAAAATLAEARRLLVQCSDAGGVAEADAQRSLSECKGGPA